MKETTDSNKISYKDNIPFLQSYIEKLETKLHLQTKRIEDLTNNETKESSQLKQKIANQQMYIDDIEKERKRLLESNTVLTQKINNLQPEILSAISKEKSNTKSLNSKFPPSNKIPMEANTLKSAYDQIYISYEYIVKEKEEACYLLREETISNESLRKQIEILKDIIDKFLKSNNLKLLLEKQKKYYEAECSDIDIFVDVMNALEENTKLKDEISLLDKELFVLRDEKQKLITNIKNGIKEFEELKNLFETVNNENQLLKSEKNLFAVSKGNNTNTISSNYQHQQQQQSNPFKNNLSIKEKDLILHKQIVEQFDYIPESKEKEFKKYQESERQNYNLNKELTQLREEFKDFKSTMNSKRNEDEENERKLIEELKITKEEIRENKDKVKSLINHNSSLENRNKELQFYIEELNSTLCQYKSQLDNSIYEKPDLSLATKMELNSIQFSLVDKLTVLITNLGNNKQLKEKIKNCEIITINDNPNDLINKIKDFTACVSYIISILSENNEVEIKKESIYHKKEKDFYYEIEGLKEELRAKDEYIITLEANNKDREAKKIYYIFETILNNLHDKILKMLNSHNLNEQINEACKRLEHNIKTNKNKLFNSIDKDFTVLINGTNNILNNLIEEYSFVLQAYSNSKLEKNDHDSIIFNFLKSLSASSSLAVPFISDLNEVNECIKSLQNQSSAPSVNKVFSLINNAYSILINSTINLKKEVKALKSDNKKLYSELKSILGLRNNSSGFSSKAFKYLETIIGLFLKRFRNEQTLDMIIDKFYNEINNILFIEQELDIINSKIAKDITETALSLLNDKKNKFIDSLSESDKKIHKFLIAISEIVNSINI